jgi:hypothetical protein
MRRCVGLSAVRHWYLHSSGCDVLREQAPSNAWSLPARIAPEETAETTDRVPVLGSSSMAASRNQKMR